MSQGVYVLGGKCHGGKCLGGGCHVLEPPVTHWEITLMDRVARRSSLGL